LARRDVMGVEDEYFAEQEQLDRDEQDAIEDGMANNGPPETRRSRAYWEKRSEAEEEAKKYNRVLEWEPESE
jgi:hypothetical protein